MNSRERAEQAVRDWQASGGPIEQLAVYVHRAIDLAIRAERQRLGDMVRAGGPSVVYNSRPFPTLLPGDGS